MLTIRVHNKFKKDLKLMLKRGYDEEKLWSVVESLAMRYLCRHTIVIML